MLVEEIPKILSGTNARVPQNEREARYWPRRKPEDGVIDWNSSVRHIYNLIRVLVKPHPGAFYIDNTGQKIVLDEYKYIPQVTNLKYSLSGGRKELKSKYTKLEPLNEEDGSIISKWIDEPNLIMGNCIKKEKSQNILRLPLNCNNHVFFSIKLLNNNEIIGFGQLYNINYQKQSANIQANINDGIDNFIFYAIDAIQQILYFAFEELGLNQVSTKICSAENSIIELYGQIGFSKCSGYQSAKQNNNLYGDEIIMVMQRKK